jgi:hypothetical protein
MSWGPLPIRKAAITYSDYLKYGCPICLSGETKGITYLSHSSVSLFECSHCGVAYFICGDNVKSNNADLALNNAPIIEHPGKEQNV